MHIVLKNIYLKLSSNSEALKKESLEKNVSEMLTSIIFGSVAISITISCVYIYSIWHWDIEILYTIKYIRSFILKQLGH